MLKTKILEYFIENNETVISLSKFSEMFEVSRNACWKAINKLIESGHNIELIKNKGYIYYSSDMLSSEVINHYLDNKYNVTVLESVDSTNTYIKEHDTNDLVIAKEQVSGRGRRGKSFLSLKDTGIYMSYKHKSVIAVEDISFVTVCSAVSVVRCLEALYDIECDVKWLNDIYINNKKLCGILTEATILAEEKTATDFIIGIGLNTKKVASEISDIATSLSEVTKIKIDRNILIAELVKHFQIVFDEYFNKHNDILEEYRSYQFIIGKTVTVIDGEQKYRAEVMQINDDATLQVKVDNELKNINSATISLEVSYE